MNGKSTLAYSRLGSILAGHHWTVAGFIEKLTAKGIVLDKKTVYRLAGPKPIQTINTRVLGVICQELKIGVDQILTWQPPQPTLHRIDDKMQQRLSHLMEKNSAGTITETEFRELAELGAYAEKLSLENARLLADIAETRSQRAAPSKKSPSASVSRKSQPVSRRKVVA